MKTKVELDLSRMNIPELLGFSTHIVSKMRGSRFFPSPQPTLERVMNATQELEDVFNLAQGAEPGQIAAVNHNREILELLLVALGGYVEGRANAPAGAESIILSAGMNVMQFTPIQKQTFRAMQSGLPDAVSTVAEGVVRGSQEWKFIHSASEMWAGADPRIKVNTMSGLKKGKRYSFRNGAVIKESITVWDDESITAV